MMLYFSRVTGYSRCSQKNVSSKSGTQSCQRRLGRFRCKHLPASNKRLDNAYIYRHLSRFVLESNGLSAYYTAHQDKREENDQASFLEVPCCQQDPYSFPRSFISSMSTRDLFSLEFIPAVVRTNDINRTLNHTKIRKVHI